MNDRVRAWTLLDELVLELFVMTKRPVGEGLGEIASSLRASSVRAALLVARGMHGENGSFHTCARASLAELADLRYHLYLARRLALIDTRQYRAAAGRYERARKSLRELLGEDPDGGPAPAEPAPHPGAPLARRDMNP